MYAYIVSNPGSQRIKAFYFFLLKPLPVTVNNTMIITVDPFLSLLPFQLIVFILIVMLGYYSFCCPLIMYCTFFLSLSQR